MKSQWLTVGERYIIDGIDEGHHAAKKMTDMGMTPGSDFEVLGVAPFGDPVLLRVRNYALAVRKSDLAALAVRAQP